MKRMSEVFQLPLSYVDVAEFTVNLTVDEVFHVRAAINHIDALVDALQVLLNDACDNGMHNRTSVYAAGKALAAYRGGK